MRTRNIQQTRLTRGGVLDIYSSFTRLYYLLFYFLCLLTIRATLPNHEGDASRMLFSSLNFLLEVETVSYILLLFRSSTNCYLEFVLAAKLF